MLDPCFLGGERIQGQGLGDGIIIWMLDPCFLGGERIQGQGLGDGILIYHLPTPSNPRCAQRTMNTNKTKMK